MREDGEFMYWKDRYELGVDLIDTQHKELFARVEVFMQKVRQAEDWDKKIAQVNETLEFMKVYVVEHFRDEEAYQQHIGYPGFEKHKKLHESMVQYVLDTCSEYESKGFSEQLIQQFSGKLLAWLINHVASEDQQIAEFAIEKGVQHDGK